MSILLSSCNSDEHAEQGFSILNAEAIVPGMHKQRNIHNIYNHLLTNYSRNLVFPPKLKNRLNCVGTTYHLGGATFSVL